MNNLGWLIGGVVLAALAGWLGGRSAATSVVASDSAAATLAPRVVADPAFESALASSSALSGLVADRAEGVMNDAVMNGNLVGQLLQDPGTIEMFDDSVSRSLYEGGAKAQLEQAVKQAVAATPAAVSGSSKAGAGVDSAQVDRLQRAMRNYDSRLKQLANQVQDDESAAAVNAMQGQLFEMQGLLSGLSKDVRCMVAAGAGTRSFLLKERRSTPLSGVDLVVSLGRLRKGVLNTVSISGRNPNAGAGEAQGVTAVKANVRIGKPFQFSANGRGYEGAFTYSQGRWGPDFVGFEMREVASTTGESVDC